MKSMHSCCF